MSARRNRRRGRHMKRRPAPNECHSPILYGRETAHPLRSIPGKDWNLTTALSTSSRAAVNSASSAIAIAAVFPSSPNGDWNTSSGGHSHRPLQNANGVRRDIKRQPRKTRKMKRTLQQRSPTCCWNKRERHFSYVACHHDEALTTRKDGSVFELTN